MSGKGDHSIDVIITNHAPTTLDITSADVEDGSWITGGNYTLPKVGVRIKPSETQTWGVYTNETSADPTGKVALHGDGGTAYVTFDNNGSGTSNCQFDQDDPVKLKGTCKQKVSEDAAYVAWTCDIKTK